MKRDPRPIPEDIIHRAIVELLRFKAHPKLLFHHAPNGLPSSPRAAVRFLRLGMLPGVADLCLTLPDGRTAFLEVKTAKGRQSLTQVAFEAACRDRGIPYAVARSSQEAEAILDGWGALRSVNPVSLERAA